MRERLGAASGVGESCPCGSERCHSLDLIKFVPSNLYNCSTNHGSSKHKFKTFLSPWIWFRFSGSQTPFTGSGELPCPGLLSLNVYPNFACFVLPTHTHYRRPPLVWENNNPCPEFNSHNIQFYTQIGFPGHRGTLKCCTAMS